MIWKHALWVACGGFFGSAARFLVGSAVQNLRGGVFPSGILAVNLLGCFLIGAVGGYLEGSDVLSKGVRLFVLVGFFGGFTTFSTFGYDTLSLLRGHHLGLALANVLLQLVGGLLAVGGGFGLVKVIQNA